MSDSEKPSGTFGNYAPTNADADSGVPSNYEICDASGFKARVGELVTQWNGLRVLPRFFEHRHPQDFVRARPERPRPSTRPEGPDVFYGLSFPLATEAGEYLELEDGSGYLYTEADEVSVESL